MSQRKRGYPRMCAYCRKLFAKGFLTKDHIPPQGLYGKEWRKGKELPWVDCCRFCREGQSAGDEALKTMAGVGAVRLPIIERIQDEAWRALQRPSWIRKQFQQAVDRSEERKVFGTVPALFMEMSEEFGVETYKAVRRIVTAILFDWNPEWDSLNHDLIVTCKNEGDLPVIDDVLEQIAGDLRHWKNLADGMLIARWDFCGERPGYGMFVMSIYGTLFFFIMIRRKGDPFPSAGIPA